MGDRGIRGENSQLATANKAQDTFWATLPRSSLSHTDMSNSVIQFVAE